MTETVSNIFYGSTFLFTLLLIIGLWILAYRYPQARRLWLWLALGWSVNTLSSLVWGLYATLVSEDIPGFIDWLYVARYGFVLLAVWLYPRVWPWRRALEILGMMLVAAAVLWFSIVQPLLAASSQTRDYILAGTIFPLLDAGMIYATWRRWYEVREPTLRPVMGWMVLSTLAYGIANLANYQVRAITPDGNSLIALAGWLLTDVCAALAAVWFVRKMAKSSTRFL